MSDHAVKGHGVHFYRVKENTDLRRWWARLEKTEEELLFLCSLGAVYRQGFRLDPDSSLKAGDILRIHTQPRRFDLPTGGVESRIVAEEEHFFLLDKPAGLPVHPTLDNRLENCLHWVSRERGQKYFITHRLDVGTSGLLIFAKTEAAQRAFMTAFQKGLIGKTYAALVPQGSRFTSGEILRHWMVASPWAPKQLIDEAREGHRICLSQVMKKSEHPLGDHLELSLQTGRTHQLRAQLSHRGSPILGDRLYGSRIPWEAPGTWALRSVGISFSIFAKEYSYRIKAY